MAEFAHVADLVPEGSMPEIGVRVVGYLDEDGELSWSWDMEGEVPLAETIGLLFMAIFDTCHLRAHNGSGEFSESDE